MQHQEHDKVIIRIRPNGVAEIVCSCKGLLERVQTGMGDHTHNLVSKTYVQVTAIRHQLGIQMEYID